MVSKQVLFEGRVQGVGFRFQTKQLAQGFAVTGWVRNLPDGRVEVQVRGEEQEVGQFLRAFRQSSSLAHLIDGMEVTAIPDLVGLTGFSIR